jgi:hypothetical protein
VRSGRVILLLSVLVPLLALSCSKVVTAGPDPVAEPEEPAREPVYPKPGNGWTVTTVAEGITYYTFDGLDPVSNARQRVFVTDIDLNNPAYAVKLGFYSTPVTASEMFRSKNAIACINAGYESASIWIRFENEDKANISNMFIPDGSYKVPQWKSEAAVYLDNDRDVRIEFTGKGVSADKWRNLYFERSRSESNLITSAPMLIDDYEPVGKDFCRLHPVQFPKSAEDPYNHQSSETHPRTAVAKTGFNHVLFIVVDGRRPGLSRGISAAGLTDFLVANFNPRYALNLDGGGSSTMCVRGKGDAITHVVNYPTDNMYGPGKDGSPQESGIPDHAGQRPRNTFLYVVER